ncbi:MAG: hypothetical protein K9L30_08795 [Desulfobacterales bacterium]|nr:hypothetical protein [Desulfobacterales bacterium]
MSAGFFTHAGKRFGLLRHSFILSLLAALLITGGCASSLTTATNKYYSGNPAAAADALEDDTDYAEKDLLLFYMEKGTVLHYLGDYENSTLAFLQASKILKRLDFISLTAETASLITNDWIKAYKGEYAERLWIHTYLMMNYLLQDLYEDALVEGKQALKIQQTYAVPLKEDYYTKALTALCYELLHENNDAYIAYKNLAESMPDADILLPKLYRLSYGLGIMDEAAFYKKKLDQQKITIENRFNESELVLFIANGRIPEKRSKDIILPPGFRFSIPVYMKSVAPAITIDIETKDNKMIATDIKINTRLDLVADKSLDARQKLIIAKEITRIAAKEAIIRSINENDELYLGFLLRTLFIIVESADTRSWKTLPVEIRLLRIPLPAGTHDLNIVLRQGGTATRKIELPDLKIKEGQKIFRTLRID